MVVVLPVIVVVIEGAMVTADIDEAVEDDLDD